MTDEAEGTGRHDLERLKAHILSLSRSTDFATACKEWDPTHVQVYLGSCPCGMTIMDHCFLWNRVTGTSTHVGNVCVGRFMGLPTDSTLFEGLKRIHRRPVSAPNVAVIEYAERQGLLQGREADFLRDTRKKRQLTLRQAAWREAINARILGKTVFLPIDI